MKPDWSKAPEWANYWAVDENGEALQKRPRTADDIVNERVIPAIQETVDDGYRDGEEETLEHDKEQSREEIAHDENHAIDSERIR